MKTKKTFKVVMLLTEKASNIYLWDDRYYHAPIPENITNVGGYNKKPTQFFELYIISDKEIKEGDWFIFADAPEFVEDLPNYKIIQATKPHKGFGCRKIVATTDKSILEAYSKDMSKEDFFPQLSESFIQAYIKAYNEAKPITEVDLELKPDDYVKGTCTDWTKGGEVRKTLEPIFTTNTIKTREDNTVIVHQSKMYSREEVEQKIRRAINEIFGKLVGLPKTSINKWISENL